MLRLFVLILTHTLQRWRNAGMVPGVLNKPWGSGAASASPRPWALLIHALPPLSTALFVFYLIDNPYFWALSLGKCRITPGGPTHRRPAALGYESLFRPHLLPWLLGPDCRSHATLSSSSSTPPLCVCVLYFIFSATYPPSNTHMHTHMSVVQTGVLGILQLIFKYLLIKSRDWGFLPELLEADLSTLPPEAVAVTRWRGAHRSPLPHYMLVGQPKQF